MWESYKKQLTQVTSLEQWEEIRLALLGKKGVLTEALKQLGRMDPEERKIKGQELNQLRELFTQMLAEQKERLEQQAMNDRIEKERVDITLRKPQEQGTQHPLSQVIQRIQEHFLNRGFALQEGPEIEEEFYNFDALNFPAHHPARQTQDTFFCGDRLLRTHTSTVQIRTMQKVKPPLRLISLGRVYRSDHDATHSPMFHQVEGLVVEDGVHMGHLKDTLLRFCRDFFGDSGIDIRFRPSYFPFTEPSAEIDMQLNGQWLEIGGCGMVHPNVFTNCEIENATGFAFGLGIERLAMIYFGISDLRLFFENHIPFLQHFQER